MDLIEFGDKLGPADLGKEFDRFVTAFNLGWPGPTGLRPFERGVDPRGVLRGIRIGFADLASGKPFMRPLFLPVPGHEKPQRALYMEGILWRPSSAWVGRVYTLDTDQFIFSQVFDLLVEVGPWLRLCKRDGCGRFFLYARSKQVYCSDKCAQRVRMARYLEQRAAGPGMRRSRPSRRALLGKAHKPKKR